MRCPTNALNASDSPTNALNAPDSEYMIVLLNYCVSLKRHSLVLVCIADGAAVNGEQRTGRSRRSTRKVTDFALMHEGNTQELTAKVLISLEVPSHMPSRNVCDI